MSDSAPLNLQLGLVNSAGGYLTAETFGFKVTASGTSLKRKQTWTLASAASAGSNVGDSVVLRSHLGRLLAACRDGAVTCDVENPEAGGGGGEGSGGADGTGGAAAAWVLQPRPDGRWALRNAEHGRYLGGSADRVRCFAQTPSTTELWSVHLAIHPQLNLYNPGRKRYAQLSGDSVSVCGDMPWGVSSLLSLAFGDDKRYSLRTSDGRCLHADGSLGSHSSASASFAIEFDTGRVAFKDAGGRYLSPSGPTGILKSARAASARPGKDELFVVEESRPQVTLRGSSGRAVSARQGLDISANQEEEGDTETFQLESVPGGGWSLRCLGGAYWGLNAASGGLQATASSRSSAAVFDIEWQGVSVLLRIKGGKFVTAKKNGQLQATTDTPGDAESFVLRVVNRSLLVLRGSHGFVAGRKGGSAVDANRATHEQLALTSATTGQYYIHGEDGRAWVVSADGCVSVSDSSEPTPFCLELHPPNRVAIRVESSGCYVRGDHASSLRANSETLDSESLWEF